MAALPDLDYSEIDYSVDLNPLAAKYGVARDDLAQARDEYWNGRQSKYIADNPGMHVAGDTLTAIKQMKGEAPLNANDAYGNNSGSPTPSTPADQWTAPSGPTTTTTTTNAPDVVSGPYKETPPAGLPPSLPVTGTTAAPAADPTTGSIGAATPNARHTALYDQLLARINQPITPDPNDPTIRRQADAYSANQTRQMRDSLANMAESAGPYANLTGETRLAAERAGQSSGAFEAQLIGREQDARRESIRSDLALYGNLMSDEEKMQLEEELGLLGAANTATGNANNRYATDVGAATNRYGIDTGAATTRYNTDKDYDALMRRLGLDSWVQANQDDYRRSGI